MKKEIEVKEILTADQYYDILFKEMGFTNGSKSRELHDYILTLDKLNNFGWRHLYFVEAKQVLGINPGNNNTIPYCLDKMLEVGLIDKKTEKKKTYVRLKYEARPGYTMSHVTNYRIINKVNNIDEVVFPRF